MQHEAALPGFHWTQNPNTSVKTWCYTNTLSGFYHCFIFNIYEMYFHTFTVSSLSSTDFYFSSLKQLAIHCWQHFSQLLLHLKLQRKGPFEVPSIGIMWLLHNQRYALKLPLRVEPSLENRLSLQAALPIHVGLSCYLSLPREMNTAFCVRPTFRTEGCPNASLILSTVITHPELKCGHLQVRCDRHSTEPQNLGREGKNNFSIENGRKNSM